ncbi:MAG: DMT family transporter, partial [Opitutales bacterium]
MSPKSSMLAGAALAVGSSALFTGKVIVAKLAYARGIDPLGMVLLRMVFASPFFAVILIFELRRGVRVPARDVALAMFFGLLSYYLASILDFTGIQYISTALERMTLQLSPSFVVLIGVLFLGEKLDLRVLRAIGIGYFGVALMVYSEMGLGSQSARSAQSWIGVICVLGATLSFSFYVLGAERMMRRMGLTFVASSMLLDESFTLVKLLGIL